MKRLFPLLVILLISLGASAPAWATSQEDVVLAFTTQSSPATGEQLLQSDEDAEGAPSDSAPDVSKAYSSLYKTNRDRARYEGKAFSSALLGGLGGTAAGGLMMLLFAGTGGGPGAVGAVLFFAGPFVAFAVAFAIDKFYQTPYGRILLGGFAGALGATMITGSMTFISAFPNNFLEDLAAAGIGTLAFLLLPALGGFISAVTGQDKIERKRLVALGPTPSGIHGNDVGVGLNGRF